MKAYVDISKNEEACPQALCAKALNGWAKRKQEERWKMYEEGVYMNTECLFSRFIYKWAKDLLKWSTDLLGMARSRIRRVVWVIKGDCVLNRHLNKLRLSNAWTCSIYKKKQDLISNYRKFLHLRRRMLWGGSFKSCCCGILETLIAASSDWYSWFASWLRIIRSMFHGHESGRPNCYNSNVQNESWEFTGIGWKPKASSKSPYFSYDNTFDKTPLQMQST